MSLLSITCLVLAIGGTLYGIYWAWKEDYFSWEEVKSSLSMDGIKETIIVMFSQPKFVFLYLVFILVPVWVLTDILKSALPVVPLYQKIILSVAGIWMISYIMNKKGVTE